MNILDRIISQKRVEVKERKLLIPAPQLEALAQARHSTISMVKALRQTGASGIISEIKRKSPSKGMINGNVSVAETSVGYVKAGASALSILTDHEFFGGSSEDLILARSLNTCPILRKDFIIDEYQILEARAWGADVILLIAAALESQQLKGLCQFAHSLGLEVLMEVHDEEEIRNNLDAGADLIGVNNRNLKTFELNVETSKRLAKWIPDQVVKISESGIESVDTIGDLCGFGYEGFLMGQTFMQAPEPAVAAADFISRLKNKKRQH